MRHFLDLFSGLGGASEAFVDRPGWSVLRIDNNPILSGVPYTRIKDVKKMWIQPYAHATIDVVWASPPCREFSLGYNSPRSIATRNGEPYEPDLSLVLRAVEIIDIVKPRYWIIENVIGSIKYLKPILGEPRQIIGPYVLWGNFPLLSVDKGGLTHKKDKDVHSGNPLRSNIKAKVDLEISRALLRAVETQQSILDY